MSQPFAEKYAPLRVNTERLSADFKALAQIGLTPENGISRLALSTADLRARAWFSEQIELAGLRARDDEAGNLSGLLFSKRKEARTLLIGSHLDSVPNGGKYDGSTGVLAALECLRVLHEEQVELPFHLEAISFTDDEGCWRSLFGSRAIAGMLTDEDVADTRVDNGPFRAALMRAGIEPRTVFAAERSPSSLVGYLELHIEQGERLERSKNDIGIVTGIVGRTTYEMRFYGQAAHSGTTEMYRRRDALRGAAQFIVRTHDEVRERYGDGVLNCGDIEVKPGRFNIIPSYARLIVECRHVKADLMAEMEMMLVKIARECAVKNGLQVECEQIAHMPAAQMDAQTVDSIEAACRKLNLRHTTMVSYAGHDAQIMSRIAPTGMIFIPSVGGISHSPQEFTEWEDVLNGCNTVLQTILALADLEKAR